jgi:hypothetical protein
MVYIIAESMSHRYGVFTPSLKSGCFGLKKASTFFTKPNNHRAKTPITTTEQIFSIFPPATRHEGLEQPAYDAESDEGDNDGNQHGQIPIVDKCYNQAATFTASGL